MMRPLVQLAGLAVLGCGCATTPHQLNPTELQQVRADCIRRLHTAVSSNTNPAIRCGAVEGLQRGVAREAVSWIRLALLDEQPAVRFAGCLAVGRLRDEGSLAALKTLAGDEDANVRVGALYALHQLGDTRDSGWLPSLLLTHDDVSVRRNAAMVLGWIDEPTLVKHLARAMRDPDATVRQYALAAMARLGNEDAVQDLLIMAQSGVGAEEVFALLALAETRAGAHRNCYRYKLQSATHLETRLAAAYALGLLGFDNGFRLALRSLQIERPRDPNDTEDLPAEQVLRAKLLALRALGAIARPDAVPVVRDLMHSTDDERVRIACASAILRMTRKSGRLPGDFHAPEATAHAH